MILEKAIIELNAAASRQCKNVSFCIDGRFQLIVTLSYLIIVISMPIANPAALIWLFCYPILMSEAFGIGYGRILVKSLWIVPLVLVIGAFNPILDKQPIWQIGSICINRGWLTFISLILRALLSFQALLILVASCGFYYVCLSLQRLKFPRILVTQLLMLYRYLSVLLQEALGMQQAREARGFGKKSYPLKMWATFAGQLFIRSANRATRIHQAMLARGFDGNFTFCVRESKATARDWIYMLVWLGVFIALRLIDMSAMMALILHR